MTHTRGCYCCCCCCCCRRTWRVLLSSPGLSCRAIMFRTHVFSWNEQGRRSVGGEAGAKGDGGLINGGGHPLGTVHSRGRGHGAFVSRYVYLEVFQVRWAVYACGAQLLPPPVIDNILLFFFFFLPGSRLRCFRSWSTRVCECMV